MSYTPRSTEDIEQGLIARIVARSRLSDIGVGAVARRVLRVVAEEVAGVEGRLKGIRDSFGFWNPQMSEADVDERLAELPGDAAKRLPASAASGSVVAVTRESSTGAQTLPKGSTLRRKDAPGVLYRTSVDVEFADGVLALSGVHVVCLTRGTAGNCASGLINQIVSAPSWLLSAVNTEPLSNGRERETKEEAIERARAYMSSHSRCQPIALWFLAKSFTATDGTRARFASVYEDETENGRTELLVDDGTGLTGLVTAGATTTGTVPAVGQTLLWHQAPATEPIASVSVARAAGGTDILTLAAGDYVSHPERGHVIVPAGELLPGDVWTIEGYSAYAGLLAELQAEIEGNKAQPAVTPGWRASGTHVLVLPPDVLSTNLLIHVVPVSFADLAAVLQEVQDAAVTYCSTLAARQPLYIAGLIDRIMDNPNVLNVRVYEPASDPLAPKDDVYPGARQVVRTTAASVEVVPAG